MFLENSYKILQIHYFSYIFIKFLTKTFLNCKSEYHEISTNNKRFPEIKYFIKEYLIMKKRNSKKCYKRSKKQKYQREYQPEFLIKVKLLDYKDLKEMNLIDSRTYREYIKKQIKFDYQGGDVDE